VDDMAEAAVEGAKDGAEEVVVTEGATDAEIERIDGGAERAESQEDADEFDEYEDGLRNAS